MIQLIDHAETQAALRHLRSTALGIGLALATGLVSQPASAEQAYSIPAPAVDEQNATVQGHEVAVLAGGCFWGVQGVFQHVNGIVNAVSGYAGGDKKTAHYEMVGSGGTGHAGVGADHL